MQPYQNLLVYRETAILMISFLHASVFFITGVFQLCFSILLIQKHKANNKIHWTMLAYTMLLVLWSVGTGGLLYTNLNLPFQAAIPKLSGLVVVTLAFLYLAITRYFLRQPGFTWPWWFFGITWGIILVSIEFANQQGWIFSGSSPGLVENSATILAGVTWAGLVVRQTRLVQSNYKVQTQPLFKNRIKYWNVASILGIAAGVTMLTGVLWLAAVLYLLSTGIGIYAILTHRQPIIALDIQHILSLFLTAMFAWFIYVLGYIITQFYLQVYKGYSPLLTGLFFGGMLTIVFLPLIKIVKTIIETSLSKNQLLDQTTLVREYNLAISNILDLSLLGKIIIRLLDETFDIEAGILFLIDKHTQEDGQDFYKFTDIADYKNAKSNAGYLLPAEDEIAKHFQKAQNPLTQYDIDFHNQFEQSHPNVREWFSGLEMDVYVPLYSKGQLFGLLALGTKQSGKPYTKDDLSFLQVLSDQTAISLENARLFEGVVRMNKELEKAYQNLNKTKKDLERMDRAKTDFIGVSSHELRTPLTVIQGYVQMLQDDPTISSNPYHNQLTNGILTGTSRLHEIVETMLDIAKIDQRSFELNHHPVVLSTMIQAICSGFAKALTERNILIHIDPLGNLPTIEADGDALQKVFYNIIINAIKYTPDGGKILISGKKLSPDDTFLPHGGVEITIADQGIGIAPEHHELIFKKFYQTGEIDLHSTGKTKFKGSGPGLGLAIAKGIIQAHMGKIWAESPGYDETKFPGSTFYIVLPLVQFSSSGQGKFQSANAAQLPLDGSQLY